MKKLYPLFLLAFVGLLPLKTDAIGFLNPSFEDPTSGNFWECEGCQDVGNYIVENDAAINGSHFAVVLNGVSIMQEVSVPTKGDTTRLTFWYRNTGDTTVLIKRNGKTIISEKLLQSKNKWKKMKIDNVPQGKKVKVIIQNNGEGYSFFDNFEFKKQNRQKVAVQVMQDGEPLADATVKLLLRKNQKLQRFFTVKGKKTYQVKTNSEGVAQMRLDPSTKKYFIRAGKDGISARVNFKNPKANASKTKKIELESLLETPLTEE